jgi:hypothetical protein
MNLGYIFNHRNGEAEWQRRELYDWLTDVFDLPGISLGQGCTSDVRNHVRSELVKEGWATNVKIAPEYDLTVFATRDDLGFHLQMGNMSRAPYDLLKLQYLFQAGKIETAALALPTKSAAERIGSNIANAERVCNELQLFDRIITVPILVVAFE